jgi:hypothetical protein
LTSRPPPKIVVEKNDNYRTIIQSGIFGGHRPGFFEWIIYSDEMVADEAVNTLPPDPSKVSIKRTLHCRVVLTAIEAKNMAEWLNNRIATYERMFGKILTPKDLGKAVKGAKKPPYSPYV